ncbi:Octamer-binding transcription factor [Parasponia andersonii]|uniref:Octamer-binding transcription factor n=1 Tax=Parasponia andersonii TaxID=3476 RepID=A0A2P5BTU6_PARAD|nr:Octamer-binding transcription factor [Parasponia andersonii]
MGFEQHNKIISHSQNCSNTHVPLFSEILEMYNSLQIPFFQSYSDEADEQAKEISNNIGHDQVLEVVLHDNIMEFQTEQLEKLYSSSEHSDSSKVAQRSTKQRIKWTQDLHERFVECVNSLGGAEKATPKAILKLLNSKMLTIFHVKSHLQKYRTSKYVAEHTKGKVETNSTLRGTTQLDLKTGIQIKEALQHVSRSLQEQLEIQQNMQLMIEEQGKQLKKMLDLQLKTNKNLIFMKSLQMNSDSPMQTTSNEPCNCSSSFNNVLFSMTKDSASSTFSQIYKNQE